MKAKLLSILLLMSLSCVLVAQTTESVPKKASRGPQREMKMNYQERGPAKGLNLTDVQKEAFKQSTMSMHKQLQPVRNQLGEAEAHQKTLINSEKPDFAAIDKNIEKIGALKVEMAKIQTRHDLEMRAQLTDEQRLKFDMFKGGMMQKNVAKRQIGMRQGRGMQAAHPIM
jgi:Spy/CpxP family protein refolding chaperone